MVAMDIVVVIVVIDRIFVVVMVVMVIMVIMVFMVIWSSGQTGKPGQRDGQDREIWHLNLNFPVTCVGQLSQFLRCFFFYQFSGEEEEEEQTQVVPQGDIALLGFDQLANFVIQWTASSPTSAAWTQPTSLIQSLESRLTKAAFWNLSSTMTFPDLGSASWTCPATAPLSLASTRPARAVALWTLERGLFWSPLETLCGTRYPWYQPIMSMTSTIVRVRFRKYSIFFSFINLQEKKAKVRPTPWQTTAVWKMACKITVISKTLAQP